MRPDERATERDHLVRQLNTRTTDDLIPLYERLRQTPPSFRSVDPSPLADVGDRAIGRLIVHIAKRGSAELRGRLIDDLCADPARLAAHLEDITMSTLVRPGDLHRIATIAMADPLRRFAPRTARALMLALLRTDEGTRRMDKVSYERLVAALRLETARSAVVRFCLRVLEDMLGRSDTSYARVMEMTALLYDRGLVNPARVHAYWLAPPSPMPDTSPLDPALAYRLHVGLLLARRTIGDHVGAVRSIARMVSLARYHRDQIDREGLVEWMTTVFEDAFVSVEVADEMLEAATEAILAAEGVFAVPVGVLRSFERGLTARQGRYDQRIDLLARVFESLLPSEPARRYYKTPSRRMMVEVSRVRITPATVPLLPAALVDILRYHGQQSERMATDDDADQIEEVMVRRRRHHERFEAIVKGICLGVRHKVYDPTPTLRRELLEQIVRFASLRTSLWAYRSLRSPKVMVENSLLLDIIRMTTYADQRTRTSAVEDMHLARLTLKDWLRCRRRPGVGRVRPVRMSTTVDAVVPSVVEDPLADYDLVHYDLTTFAAAASLMGSVDGVMEAYRSMIARAMVPDAHDIHVVYHALRTVGPKRASKWLRRAIYNGFRPGPTFFDHRREGVLAHELAQAKEQREEAEEAAGRGVIDVGTVEEEVEEDAMLERGVAGIEADGEPDEPTETGPDPTIESLTAPRLIDRPRMNRELAIDRFIRLGNRPIDRARNAIAALENDLPVRPRLLRLVLHDAIVHHKWAAAFRLHAVVIRRGVHERRYTLAIANGLAALDDKFTDVIRRGIRELVTDLLAHPTLAVPYINIGRLVRRLDRERPDKRWLSEVPSKRRVSRLAQRWYMHATSRSYHRRKLGNYVQRQDRISEPTVQ